MQPALADGEDAHVPRPHVAQHLLHLRELQQRRLPRRRGGRGGGEEAREEGLPGTPSRQGSGSRGGQHRRRTRRRREKAAACFAISRSRVTYVRYAGPRAHPPHMSDDPVYTSSIQFFFLFAVYLFQNSKFSYLNLRFQILLHIFRL